MDWIDYREKLGIGFDDEEKVKLFYSRMSNALDLLISDRSNYVTTGEYYAFCNETGTELDMNLMEERFGFERFLDCIHIVRDHERLLADYLSYYVWFMNCRCEIVNRPWSKGDVRDLIIRQLDEAHIPYDLLEDNGKIFIFPKGAMELDCALISEPLEWLAAYPHSHTIFVKALKEYANATSENASEIADKFRKSLETFFQEFFTTDKSLENCKSDYGTYLKNHGIPAEICRNFETLLQSYTNFMNNYAKHHNRASLNVLEYLLYQTGNIIRLLITLKQEALDNAD